MKKERAGVLRKAAPEKLQPLEPFLIKERTDRFSYAPYRGTSLIRKRPPPRTLQ